MNPHLPHLHVQVRLPQNFVQVHVHEHAHVQVAQMSQVIHQIQVVNLLDVRDFHLTLQVSLEWANLYAKNSNWSAGLSRFSQNRYSGNAPAHITLAKLARPQDFVEEDCDSRYERHGPRCSTRRLPRLPRTVPLFD